MLHDFFQYQRLVHLAKTAGTAFFQLYRDQWLPLFFRQSLVVEIWLKSRGFLGVLRMLMRQ